jgi:hypothetical protein
MPKRCIRGDEELARLPADPCVMYDTLARSVRAFIRHA